MISYFYTALSNENKTHNTQNFNNDEELFSLIVTT